MNSTTADMRQAYPEEVCARMILIRGNLTLVGISEQPLTLTVIPRVRLHQQIWNNAMLRSESPKGTSATVNSILTNTSIYK
jgi:hypothetical protein